MNKRQKEWLSNKRKARRAKITPKQFRHMMDMIEKAKLHRVKFNKLLRVRKVTKLDIFKTLRWASIMKEWHDRTGRKDVKVLFVQLVHDASRLFHRRMRNTKRDEKGRFITKSTEPTKEESKEHLDKIVQEFSETNKDPNASK